MINLIPFLVCNESKQGDFSHLKPDKIKELDIYQTRETPTKIYKKSAFQSWISLLQIPSKILKASIIESLRIGKETSCRKIQRFINSKIKKIKKDKTKNESPIHIGQISWLLAANTNPYLW